MGKCLKVFKKLFSSLFVNPEAYIELIKLISEKKGGVGRIWLESKSCVHDKIFIDHYCKGLNSG